MNGNNIKPKITKFVIEHFLKTSGKKSLNDDDSFLEQGILDSTGVLELVSFLEDTFKIKVEDEELIPDNLDSVTKLVGFISSKFK